MLVVLFLYQSGAKQLAVLCSSQLDAWLGGQNWLMPMTHKNQIESNQIQAAPCRRRKTDTGMQIVEPHMDLPSSAWHRQTIDTCLLLCL